MKEKIFRHDMKLEMKGGDPDDDAAISVYARLKGGEILRPDLQHDHKVFP